MMYVYADVRMRRGWGSARGVKGGVKITKFLRTSFMDDPKQTSHYTQAYKASHTNRSITELYPEPPNCTEGQLVTANQLRKLLS